MKLVIMTRPTFFVEEDKILTTLFDEGLECLHLYKPGASPMYSERLLSLLSEQTYNKIVVHDHYYLKSEYRLAGIHLDASKHEPPKDYKGKFSRTCNDINKLHEMKRHAEYVFLANTFGITAGCTESYTHTATELETAADSGIIDRHVYALGGITLDNIRTARDFGFGGVVVCEDLWSKFDIHNQLDYKGLISHFDKLRKAIS